MSVRPLAAMAHPVHAPPPRRPLSIRRTSHIDMVFVEPGLVLDGAARDLITRHDRAEVQDSARVHVEVDPSGRVVALVTEPANPTLTQLVGRPIRRGFRDAVASVVADDVAAGTPLALLLDDLPVATLISGYARLYRGDVGPSAAGQGPQVDICSGWRAGGTMMVSFSDGEGVATEGPPAPTVAEEVASDPLGWHELTPLPVGAMRRRRLVDVHVVDGAWNVQAMFRDTHVDGDGAETVLHEYTLTASVDPTTATFTSCAAVPRVLPWVECPVAAASADRLVGRPVSAVRQLVRAELRGTSTCTHLNDLLRSLGDVDTLAAALMVEAE